MGVTGLLGLLKSIQKPCNLKRFAGQTIGVDAYGWLHRGAIACAIELATGKGTTKFVDFAMHRVAMMIHFGITPYLVFDGDRLPSKATIEKSRSDRRKESRVSGLQFLSMGKTAQAFQELQKAVDITPEMARQLIAALKTAGVQYVVAPYEADSQLAYLERKGIINAILSEDSDLLVFGAKCLLTKLDQYGECVMIRREDFAACREVNLTGWTNTEFRTMAILSGCDYLDGIHKMGLKTAHRMVRKHKSIDRIIRAAQLEGKFKIPPGYLQDFIQAEKTFLYQWVYCPQSQCLVNLTSPESEDELAGLNYIGEHVSHAIATGVANGDLNPMTKQQISVDPSWSRRTFDTKGMKSASIEPIKGKSLDAFFKPNRVPLAELDPNSFTPSPSQQQLLQRQGRPWSATAAPARYIPPATTTAAEWQQDLARQRVASAPHPSKRQRLCSDGVDVLSGFVRAGERSRFFKSSAPESSPSLGPSSRSQELKKPDINLWSDDSIDDAMAALADVANLSPQTKLSKIPIFSDSQPDVYAAASNHLTEGVPVDFPGVKPIPATSKFSAHLLRETQALRDKFSFTPQPLANHIPRSSKIPRLITSPPAARNSRGLHTTTCKTPASLSIPTKAAPSPAPRPLTYSNQPRQRQPQRQRQLESPTTPAKGSEDILLVPDSANSSRYGNRGSISPLTKTDDNDDDENKAQNPTPSPQPELVPVPLPQPLAPALSSAASNKENGQEIVADSEEDEDEEVDNSSNVAAQGINLRRFAFEGVAGWGLR